VKCAVVVAISLGLVALLGLSHRADAYPQFQLSRDQTCASCHISPAGGGILNENGLNVAETMSTFGTPPGPLHGWVETPSWFMFSGDLRFAGGLVVQHGARGAAFPMQGELDFAARGRGFTAYATIGAQAGTGSRPWTYVLLREHWLMWQPEENATEGLFVRAGRFMPVYGLRFAEHNFFVRRYGQTPLYGETYGAAVEYVRPAYDVHATAFVHDPLQDPIERGNGAAVYGETRFGKSSIGVEGRYAKSQDDGRLAGGLTAKQWIPSANLLLEAEGQVIRQSFNAGGPSRTQVVSQLLGTWFFHDGFMLDIGLSQFDQDVSIANNDLEAFDGNLHWFATSHWELLFQNRVQTIQLGSGGRTSGYSLVQLHYRI
jgi:hypothetical protein